MEKPIVPNPEMKKLTEEFLNQIDDNHNQIGNHAKKPKEWPFDSDAAAKFDEEFKAKARAEAKQRAETKKETNTIITKLKKQLKWQEIVNAGLAIIIAGTLAGFVAASSTKKTEIENPTPLEQPDDNIIPTQEEFEAGLTQQQLREKRAIDDAENAALQAIIDESNGQVETQNKALEEKIQRGPSK